MEQMSADMRPASIEPTYSIKIIVPGNATFESLGQYFSPYRNKSLRHDLRAERG